MRESILLASPSSLLTIHLRDKECSFWLSPDRKSLMIEETLDRSISGVEMNLTRDSDNEIISSLLLPIRSPSSLISHRLDPWISFIFGNDVPLNTFDSEIPVKDEWMEKLSKFTLTLDPIRASDKPNDDLPAEIYSDSLKIGSTSLAVSRELLSLHSEFFTGLFYGSFAERTQEVKEIKEIGESEFVGFLQSLHRRRFEFASVRHAMESLEFADRFLISEASKMVLQYLKKEKLSIEQVEYAFTVAARVHNNNQIVSWLLPQFPSKSRLLEILHDSAPSMSTEIMQMCISWSLKRARESESTISELEKEKASLISERRKIQSQLEERNKQLTTRPEHNYEKMNNLIECFSLDFNVGFHLLGYDLTREKVDWQDYILKHYDESEYDQGSESESDLWRHIPKHYRTVIINDRAKYNRNAIIRFNTSGGNSIVKVQAYRN